jgi:glycosyltransferase involved in cell wall biosynthesis
VSGALQWAEEFERIRNRAPRVLHVGNIGNNAYLNARFLGTAGVECHVLAYDYYDPLATPEWEGDERPPWFAQGPLSLCVAYLAALDAGDQRRQQRLARRLRAERAVPPRIRYGVRRTRIALAERVRGRRLAVPTPRERAAGEEPPSLTDDVALFSPSLPLWRELLPRYDVVQCYSTDPIWPLLTGYRPYVAYEHGTLRVFTGDADPLSRLTAAAYRESDHTFVTNGDCLPYAERLGIPSFTPMVHPLDVELHERPRPAAAELRRRLGADVVLFCPMRHDWAIKGTDVHIRALPLVRQRLRGRVVLVLCRWGRDVARSRRLADELGVSDIVRWVDQMPRERLVTTMQAADVVLDQMTLPHFDATAPQALAAGVPVIGSYEPASTDWIVSEPAPIVSAFDAAGVADAVQRVLDREWRADFSGRARRWIRREHHPDRLVAEHVRVYAALLGGYLPPAAGAASTRNTRSSGPTSG